MRLGVVLLENVLETCGTQVRKDRTWIQTKQLNTLYHAISFLCSVIRSEQVYLTTLWEKQCFTQSTISRKRTQHPVFMARAVGSPWKSHSVWTEIIEGSRLPCSVMFCGSLFKDRGNILFLGSLHGFQRRGWDFSLQMKDKGDLEFSLSTSIVCE